jgi:hypothetical protein
MIFGINASFNPLIEPDVGHPSTDRQHALQLATAAILLELRIADEDRAAITAALQPHARQLGCRRRGRC